MKHAKMICLLLSLSILFGLFAGCHAAPSEETSYTPPVAESQASVPPATPSIQVPTEPEPSPLAEIAGSALPEEPVPEDPTVSYPLYEEPVSFTWLDIRNPDYEQGVITEGLAENQVYRIASEITGIEIEWDLRMDGTTTYALMIAGGDYPDCWGSKLTDYYASFETAYEEEAIIDLTDLIQEYMPNYLTALQSEKGLLESTYSDQGRMLSVMPINTGYTQFGAQVRGDIMDELNLEMPETFDDMYNVLKAMKSAYPESQPMILSKDGSQNCSWLGGGLGVMTTVGWRPFVQMNLYQVDGTVKLGLLEPEYREYVEMIAKWYQEDLLYQDFFTNQGMGPPQDVISSNTSFVWYGSVNEMPLLEEVLIDEDGYIVGMTDVTRNPGETIHLGDNTAKYVFSSGYTVSTDCEHPEYVLQYFDYLYSQEGKMLANYGVEGETYTYVDGEPRFTDMILANDTFSYVSALFKYCIYEGPFELDVGRYFSSFNDAQREAVARWEANRDEAWNLPTAMTLTTEENEARSAIIAEMGTYCSEMILKFMTGELPVAENWDTFTARIEDLGAQEIVDITQDALDRFNN